MKPRRGGGLASLRAVAGGGAAVEAAEARLRRAWGLVVGPALVRHTRLLRLHRGVLVVGCWEPSIIPSLRTTAEAIWPQVQDRLQRLWRLHASAMEVVPCDPPEPPPRPREKDVDLFNEVLLRLRQNR